MTMICGPIITMLLAAMTTVRISTGAVLAIPDWTEGWGGVKDDISMIPN
jgi:hypothetical protein